MCVSMSLQTPDFLLPQEWTIVIQLRNVHQFRNEQLRNVHEYKMGPSGVDSVHVSVTLENMSLRVQTVLA